MGRGFEFRSSRYAGTLDKSFARSCLWRFRAKLRHSFLCRERFRVVMDLRRRYRNTLNKWIAKEDTTSRVGTECVHLATGSTTYFDWWRLLGENQRQLVS